MGFGDNCAAPLTNGKKVATKIKARDSQMSHRSTISVKTSK